MTSFLSEVKPLTDGAHFANRMCDGSDSNNRAHSLGSCRKARRTVPIHAGNTQYHIHAHVWRNTLNQVDFDCWPSVFIGSWFATERKFIDSKRYCNKLWNIHLNLSVRILLLEHGQLEERGVEGGNIDLRIWNKILYEHFMFTNVPTPIKSRLLWDNVDKYDRSERATGNNTIQCMHLACWMTKVTDTLRILNTVCFPIAILVTRTRLAVTRTLHVCLSLKCCELKLAAVSRFDTWPHFVESDTLVT